MSKEGIKKALLGGSLLYRIDRKLGGFVARSERLSKVRRNIDRAIGEGSRKVFYRKGGKIVQNKLFVMTYDNDYTCNPRYVAEEIRRQRLPIQIVWVCPRQADVETMRFPEGVRAVRRGSAAMFEEQASAKVWLDNALNCAWYKMPKQAEQVYINTWHGSMGIKRLTGSPYWMKRAKECGELTDYCIANSTFEEQVYRESFWPNTPVLRYGHPRNDILFHPEQQQVLREKVAAALGLDVSQKWLLYAPTFRDEGETDCYNIDYAALRRALSERFGGDWVILVRKHFKNRGEEEASTEPWLKSASGYPDMQELLATADAGITDYSSWAYDYVLTRRPLFLYAPDVERYDQYRGFYYPLTETPFAIAKDNAGLDAAVCNFDDTAYQAAIDRFLAARGCYERGDAAVRMVALIKEIMGLADETTAKEEEVNSDGNDARLAGV